MAQPNRKLYISADHAGFELKSHLLKALSGLKMEDLGTHNPDRVDYPDYADRVASKIVADPSAVGIIVCGSGQGVAIRANRYPEVRAALCWNEEITKLSRSHNDANVLCLGSKFVTPDAAVNLVKLFLETEFEGGRHQPRIDKLGRRPC